MRRDMKKKLVETNRVNAGRNRRSGAGRKKGKCVNPDVIRARRENLVLEEYIDEDGEVVVDLASEVNHSRTSTTRYRSWDRKDFGENLNPLWRYLQRQVGRPWSLVYSEICENMDRRSAVGGHIFQHLFDFVVRAEEVQIIDGKPFTDGWGGEPVPITYSSKIGSWQSFYIDPRDGIIKRGGKAEERPWDRERRLKREEREDRLRQIGKDLWMSRHPETDLWYCITAIPQEYRYVEVQKRDLVWSDDGMNLKRDKYGAPIYKVRTKTVKESVHVAVPFPEGLFVPKGKIVVSCKSASKKQLKNVRR